MSIRTLNTTVREGIDWMIYDYACSKHIWICLSENTWCEAVCYESPIILCFCLLFPLTFPSSVPSVFVLHVDKLLSSF